MRPFISAFVLATALSTPAFADKMDNNDASAMKQLAQSSLNEIAAGKSASSKAQSPDVKHFAEKMVTDHGKMLEDLKSLAKRKDVVLPQDASAKDMAQMKLIERKSGADFDREYIEHMVKHHERDLKDAEAIAAKAKDADFRDTVKNAIPTMRSHHELAQRLAKSAAAGSSK